MAPVVPERTANGPALALGAVASGMPNEFQPGAGVRSPLTRITYAPGAPGRESAHVMRPPPAGSTSGSTRSNSAAKLAVGANGRGFGPHAGSSVPVDSTCRA